MNRKSKFNSTIREESSQAERLSKFEKLKTT
ncbi:hypothetical protein BN175_190079 [Clostridioides difficile T23]|uniref:Uncharacterized protein n=1 Tax=Clostridioides difficile TaxID=1496 RepID=A0A069AUP6_CLODI|nr:hypothetical protein BN163_940011 [Clostridioides difficile T5]CCK93789.1 hypothetical protein BN164_850047 [Clostridioides difficile T20]CCK97529.1 hypothetical protein BN165_860059 [Clostridioides difficile E1]CCK97915.1 hypothetical protein BN166_1080004 [Clostridioides difficile E10]CCL01836.1 hypothetical protein BN167_1130009 [Clostridioides difficile E13]CCL06881.1 hypothetical protein BN168_450025 [Clostridioides difficile CD002]CCL10975.1 hypothetical protein BN169_680055 [Clostri